MIPKVGGHHEPLQVRRGKYAKIPNSYIESHQESVDHAIYLVEGPKQNSFRTTSTLREDYFALSFLTVLFKKLRNRRGCIFSVSVHYE